ncbi:phosphate ABC transporter permease PstA, partial [uncultured Methanofollis sp.]|uniref:phosphate ABC transporter permease PstA n=1 Tax=uncultured Methanofollis sp. TaxID=262500 RepID=UPI00262049FE
DLLNGMPSIVFGLFGFAFIVLYLNVGVSLLAGMVTLGLMVLPTVIRTTEEALKTVPVAIREGSLALGATRWQTIRRVVLPPALPGILTGTILSIGRAAGETAPILFTAVVFSKRFLPASVFEPVMALPYHLFILTTNVPGAETNQYGTALVLLVLVVGIYAAAIALRNHYQKNVRW